MRYVSWFSCGAASAVATKLALDQQPGLIVAYCYVKNEHVDNLRFLRDVEKWLGIKILILKSDKYADCWEVWEKRRWLNGPGGALCTVEMKKKVRQKFQELDDIQVIGYTSEERGRADFFVENNIEVNPWFPLIEAGHDKDYCLGQLINAGIELPMMYRLGYEHANCIACVKGGMGYFNKTRRDFPNDFWRMARLERTIGASCISGMYLDELDPNAGDQTDLQLPECGLFCGQNLWFKPQ